MKNPNLYLKEYCQKLSDDHLKFLAQRLHQRLSGDLPEVFDFFSSGSSKEVDRWLAGATSCEDLYDMIDQISLVVQKEFDRRVEVGGKLVEKT